MGDVQGRVLIERVRVTRGVRVIIVENVDPGLNFTVISALETV